ncbi:MAG: hypothetical protein E6K10_01535 [Methanobacteriota archaeon]|nr:MAG: hypothetical protein E6K10_01535 [Euryarchaeota archaeon]
MDTSEIMAVALELAGQTEVPPDSGIDVPASHVRKALFGIDADGSDLLIAMQLGYDLLINHHPTGGESQVRFPLVLSKHADLLERAGVPRKAASAAVQALLDEHESAAHARNYDRLPSEARLLRMPLMAIHNPCDEIGRRVMDETLRRGVSKSSNVRGAIKVLNRLPEFRKALTKIVVRMGDEANPLGKWMVVHGAGTNGGYAVAKAAFDHGIDTVFYIHIDGGHLRRLREEYGREGPKSLVVTGHIASDSIGINVLVRELRKRGVAVDTFGGVLDV